MSRTPSGLAIIICCLFLSTLPAASQEPVDPVQGAAPEALRVFLDCQTFLCDFDHFRRAIQFVHWVRDRQDADLHVLVTAQQTGGGGWEMTFAFIGRERFEGRRDTLQLVSAPTDTQTERREDMTHTLKLGFVRYLAETPLGRRLRISLEAPEEAAPALPEHDPWDYWVFTTRLGGSLDGEESQSGLSVNGSLSANRVTDRLKINVGVSGFYRRDEFELTDTTTFVNTRESYSAQFLAVQSLSQHWSVGMRTNASRSTFLNRDLSLRGGPAIEYNIFPYSESTRRQLRIMYSAGPALFDYEEETIFGKMRETLGQHSLEAALALQQPWGSLHASVEGTQFLHDLGVHRIDTFSGFRVRIVRGLDFNLFGRLSRLKDQIYLPAEELTEEEILVQQRQRGTSFRFGLNFGLSYRFGSKFANIVNPRMGDDGGTIFFF